MLYLKNPEGEKSKSLHRTMKHLIRQILKLKKMYHLKDELHRVVTALLCFAFSLLISNISSEETINLLLCTLQGLYFCAITTYFADHSFLNLVLRVYIG